MILWGQTTIVWEEVRKYGLFLFSETLITVIMRFTYITGTFFTKLILFFHKVSFITNILFAPLQEMYASHLKLFAAVSELFRHTMFQPVIIFKMVSPVSILQGTKKVKSQSAKSGLQRIWGRTDTVIIFWDSKGILLVEFLETSATINSEQYQQILKLKNCI
jgi:hypothetical protein